MHTHIYVYTYKYTYIYICIIGQVKASTTDNSLNNGVLGTYPMGSIFPLSLKISITGIYEYMYIRIYVYILRSTCYKEYMIDVYIYIGNFLYTHVFKFLFIMHYHYLYRSLTIDIILHVYT
jgi:hypothetical protein